MHIFRRDIDFGLGKLFSGKNKDGERVSSIRKTAPVVAKLKQSPLFKDIDEATLTKVVESMEHVKKSEGDVIIKQGKEGDFFYMIEDGTVEISRTDENGSAEIIADLPPGTAFGEEALISFAPRNATVTMKTDGVLLRLHKQKFAEHVQNAVIRWLSSPEAQTEAKSGAQWLDIRDPHEYERSHLPNAISMPLDKLRDQLTDLDKEKAYICYCGNGRKSATATFILRQEGFNVAVLRGGLKSL